MSIFDHIFLYSFLFLFFYFFGSRISSVKQQSQFLFASLLLILSYAFIVGSRYGWGPDYMSYKRRLESASANAGEEFGFQFLNETIRNVGLNYVGGYILYSFIFIVSGVALIRSYREQGKYMFAFLIPATLLFVNYAIRQGLALSFVLLGLYFLNKKKWIYIPICLAIGASIHTSTVVTALMIGAVYLFIKKPLNWKYAIPIYIFFTFFFDSSKVGFIAAYFKGFSLDSKFQGYLDESDKFFGAEAANAELYTQSTVALLLSSLFYISIIYLGYVALKIKYNRHVVYLYNAFVIGVILYRAVFLFEIFRRFVEPLVMLYFIPLGYAIYICSKYLKWVYRRKRAFMPIKESARYISSNLYYSLIFLILIYLVSFWGRFIFLNPSGKFFWNI